MRTSRLKQRLLLAAIPVAVFLASVPIADAAFRLLGDRPATSLKGLYVAFGNRNYKHAPGVETDANWSTGRFGVVTDELGLRVDRARVHAVKAGQPLDVLLIGDSQGFGQGVDFEESLAGVFAQLAASGGKRVGNAAVGGHYLANQYEIVHWIRERNRLDETRILLLITPYLVATAGERNAALVGEDGRLYGRKPSSWQLAMTWVKTNTVLYARLRDAIRTMGLLPTDGGSRTALDVYPAGDAAGATERRLLESLRGFLSANDLTGQRLWIVYAPLVAELDFEPIRAAAAAQGVQVDADSPARIAASVAAALEAPFLDLRQTLLRLRSEGVTLSLPGDPHYSARASRESAEAIWQFVRQPSAIAAASSTTANTTERK